VRRTEWFGTLLVVGVLAVGQAYASGSTVELETAAVQAPRERTWTVGLGAAAVPDYEGSEDYKAVPIPMVKVMDPSGWYVEWMGNTLRANVLPSATWRLGPLARYRAERDDVDNEQVDRMEKVDAAMELGAFLGLDVNNWSFKVEAATDVADAHDGSLVGVTAGYTFPMDRWRLSLSAFTTYASDDYMSTYFGVSQADADRSGLKPYKADAGFKDVGATVVSTYRLGQRWGLVAAVRYTKLVGDAADSPLVEDVGDDNQFLAGALSSYTF